MVRNDFKLVAQHIQLFIGLTGKLSARLWIVEPWDCVNQLCDAGDRWFVRSLDRNDVPPSEPPPSFDFLSGHHHELLE
jgi:hypothetical protein